MKNPRLVAHVTAGDPPPGLTILEWLDWRRAEDGRMEGELAEQRAAILAILSGELMVH